MSTPNDPSQPKKPTLVEQLKASGKVNFLPDDHPFYRRGTVIFFRPRRTPGPPAAAPEPAPSGQGAPAEAAIKGLAMGAEALRARLLMPRLTAEEARCAPCAAPTARQRSRNGRQRR